MLVVKGYGLVNKAGRNRNAADRVRIGPTCLTRRGIVANSYRPQHFRDVTAYLVLQPGNGDTLIAFLKKAFDATENFVARDPDERIAHAEFRVGDTILELGETTGSWTSRSAMHYFVTDVDATHARALASGAKEISGPVDHDYGERSSAIEDPAGNHWYIAMSIPASPDKKATPE